MRSFRNWLRICWHSKGLDALRFVSHLDSFPANIPSWVLDWVTPIETFFDLGAEAGVTEDATFKVVHKTLVLRVTGIRFDVVAWRSNTHDSNTSHLLPLPETRLESLFPEPCQVPNGQDLLACWLLCCCRGWDTDINQIGAADRSSIDRLKSDCAAHVLCIMPGLANGAW